MMILVSNPMFLGSKNVLKLPMRLPWVCNFKIQYGIQYGHHFRVLSITFILFALECKPCCPNRCTLGHKIHRIVQEMYWIKQWPRWPLFKVEAITCISVASKTVIFWPNNMFRGHGMHLRYHKVVE